MTTRLFGEPVRRVEDPAILRGEAAFLDDVEVPGREPLHVAVVRSTVAHARVLAVDLDEARKAPGVVDAVTAADLGPGGPGRPGNGPFPHPTWFPPSAGLRE